LTTVARAKLAAAVALAVSSLGLVPDARALDVQLDTDTSFQAYEVRALGARAFVARRRLLSRLGVRLTHAFEEPDAEGRAVRVTAEAQLRLEQDFGETCLVDRALCVYALDPSDPGAWQPLAADTRLDVPLVWVEVSGLPLGTTARLGRHLVLDPIGFARVDGLRASVAPLRWLEIEALGGWLVRGTSLAATPRSDPQGSIRLDSDREVPFADPPIDTWVVGAAVEGRAGRYLRARLAIRHMWEPGVAGGTADVLSRVALAVSSTPLDGLTLSAHGVHDLLTDEVIDAAAEAAIGDRTLTVRLGADHHVPRFDPGTIWAWFAVAPIDQAYVGARWAPMDDLELGGSLRARRAELGQAGEDVDAGLDAWLRTRWEGFRIGASGFVWSGSLGPLAGVSLDVARPLFGWLDLTLDVSIWHFDDPHRSDVYGTVVSETLGGVVRLSPETRLFLELMHASSRTAGHRFRGMLALRVDLWR
jgi:hypothetical protein